MNRVLPYSYAKKRHDLQINFQYSRWKVYNILLSKFPVTQKLTAVKWKLKNSFAMTYFALYWKTTNLTKVLQFSKLFPYGRTEGKLRNSVWKYVSGLHF